MTGSLPELFVAVWPSRSYPWERLGNRNDASTLGCDILYLHLRAMANDLEHLSMRERAGFSNLALQVYFGGSDAPCVKCEVKGYEIQSLDAGEATTLGRLLRRLNARLRPLNASMPLSDAVRQSLHDLRITRAYAFRGRLASERLGLDAAFPLIEAELRRRHERASRRAA